jgi:phosphotransferase system IIB component
MKMKTTQKFFMFALLAVIAAAVVSCQDDKEWEPQWALPLIKEQTISIGDFMDSSSVGDVNNKVKEQWNSYVQQRLGENDLENIDSTAYVVLTQGDTVYVTFNNSGVPELNDETKEKIRGDAQDNSEAEKKIEEINSFLKIYSLTHPTYHNSTTQSRAMMKNNGSNANSNAGQSTSGGDTAINNLLDAMVHPTDVFTTAANLLSVMGPTYIDSINNQIDDLLGKTNMTDTIEINLADYVGEGASISGLDFYLGVKSTLPFKISLLADFIDADGRSVSSIINETFASPENPQEGQQEKQCHNSFTDKAKLKEIVEQSKGVRFSVVCQRTSSMSEDILRKLAQQSVVFNLRLKVQAPMNNF